jgi:hypothetical protein
LELSSASSLRVTQWLWVYALSAWADPRAHRAATPTHVRGVTDRFVCRGSVRQQLFFSSKMALDNDTVSVRVNHPTRTRSRRLSQ